MNSLAKHSLFFFTFLLFNSTPAFCFLSPDQESYFIELVQELSSKKNGPTSWKRIRKEIENHTYNFHTLLLVIANAETNLNSHFSLSLYNSLQQFYANMFADLWDKLSEILEPITREAATEKLKTLFNFSSPFITYNALIKQVHVSYPRYVFRRPLLDYLLTIKGLSKEALAAPGALHYNNSDKKQHLLNVKQSLKNAFVYISSYGTYSEIQSTLNIDLDILQNIEHRFVVYDKGDFITTTLPTLSKATLQLSAAASLLGSIFLGRRAINNLSAVPVTEKIVPSLEQFGILAQTFNKLTEGLTKEQLITLLKQKLEPYDKQLVGNTEEANKENVGILPKMNKTMTAINGEDIITADGKKIHKPGIIDLIHGYTILKDGVEVKVPGIAENVENMSEVMKLLMGIPTVDEKGEPNTIAKAIGRINARAQALFTTPPTDAVKEMTPVQFKVHQQRLQVLRSEPPQREGGQGEEAELPEAPSDNESKDSADEAYSASMNKLQSSLQEAEISEIKLIDEALLRIKRGEYGVCLDCAEPISDQRLEYYPYAARCIECQEAIEE